VAKKRKGFNVGGAKLQVVYAYIKSRLGYASDRNVSLFELACRALEKDGLPKPVSISYKEWTAGAEHVATVA